MRSSSSRELGSIQWRSSNIISTGRCRERPSTCRSSASNVFSFLRCGVTSSGGARSADGNECSSAISATSSIGGAVAASSACSLASLAAGSSACRKPAARSIWAITGYSALS